MSDAPHPATVTAPPVGTQPTSSSTTSVVIPSTGQPRSPYLEWDGVVFVVGGIFALIMVIKQLLEFAKSIAEWIDRKNKKDQEQDAPIMARVANVEELVKTFRSRDDLERDFGLLKTDIRHMKSNIEQSNQSVADRFRKIEGHITDDRLERARLETKVDGMVTQFARVESAVDRLGERMDDRLDRMQQFFTDSRPSTKRTPSN